MRLFVSALLTVVSFFSASAQINCLQFNLQNVVLDPLNPEVVLVSFANPSSQFVSEPGFRAYNSMTEQFLGSETVAYNFLPSESVHRVYIGSSLDLSIPHQLVFELWQNEYDTLLCGFSWIGNLSNHDSCFESELSTLAEFETSLQDVVQVEISNFDTNEEIVSETVPLGELNGQVFESLCLEEGCYHIEATMQQPSLYDYTINLFIEPYIDYYLVGIPQGFTEYSGEFEIWSGCPVSIDETDEKTVTLFPSISRDGLFEILSNSHVSKISMFNSEGRKVQEVKSTVDLEASTVKGLYVVLVEFSDQTRVVERIIVQ